jgi:putative ABC transport system ATP-binding protein
MRDSQVSGNGSLHVNAMRRGRGADAGSGAGRGPDERERGREPGEQDGEQEPGRGPGEHGRRRQLTGRDGGAEPGEPVYRLAGVVRNYQKGRRVIPALQGVDLEIARGDWLAVQGPTGHGKSTLLQVLGGLDRPSAGSVTLDGLELTRLREARVTGVRARLIGFVFQTFNLIPTLTAAENVEVALVPLRVSATSRRQRAREALAAVGLAGRLRHLPGELSGGQQQRVAIARAMVKRPAVLLADEPTGNLDEGTRDEIIDVLAGLWRERGLTMVMVTHDSAVAARAGRIAAMRDGRLTISPAPGSAGRPAGSP